MFYIRQMMPRDKNSILKKIKRHYQNIHTELAMFSAGTILFSAAMVYLAIKQTPVIGKAAFVFLCFFIPIFSLLIFPLILIYYKMFFEQQRYSFSELKSFFSDKFSEIQNYNNGRQRTKAIVDLCLRVFIFGLCAIPMAFWILFMYWEFIVKQLLNF
jgi:hypothetical protein